MTVAVKMRMDRASSAKVQSLFKKLLKEVGNTRKVNRRVGVWLLRWVILNFRSEGKSVGRWDAFANKGEYPPKGGRRRKGFKKLGQGKGTIDTSAKLLQDTGRLRASLDFKASRKSVSVGSNLKYSIYHEEGLPTRNLPERRMLPRSTDKDVEIGMIKIYNSYIKEVLG